MSFGGSEAVPVFIAGVAMRTSIFTRYFFLGIIIILFGCGLMGSVMLVWADKAHYDETYSKMRSISSLMIENSRDAYLQSDMMRLEDMEQSFSSYALTYNVSCYLFDEKGQCLVRSDHMQNKVQLSPAVMESVAMKPSMQVTDVAGLTDSLSACYVEQFALYGKQHSSTYYIALVFPADELNAFTQEMFYVMVIALLSIAALSAVAFYMAMRRMMRPVLEITKVAEQYAGGDFAPKLPIVGSDEMTYLAATMNRMSEFIDSNEHNRKSFVSNVSHELRTPITTISGFVDGILDGTIPQASQRAYLTRISGEVKRLSRLISSMLNISKFEEGEMALNLQTVDLTQVLMATLFMFEQKIEAKRAVVEGLENCGKLEITADKDLMQQVFYNLIENAVKFVSNAGTLTFSEEVEGGFAIVHIRNSGEGLTEDEISRVFDRFYKTDASRGRDTTGVGLGLSIVSRIVRLHNGHVLVRSVKGEYTEFSLRLPIKLKNKA